MNGNFYFSSGFKTSLRGLLTVKQQNRTPVHTAIIAFPLTALSGDKFNWLHPLGDLNMYLFSFETYTSFGPSG